MLPTECKYFSMCSYNKCPLDPDRKILDVSPLDKVRYCRIKRERTKERMKNKIKEKKRR
jgi:hypothetical protein